MKTDYKADNLQLILDAKIAISVVILVEAVSIIVTLSKYMGA